MIKNGKTWYNYNGIKKGYSWIFDDGTNNNHQAKI